MNINGVEIPCGDFVEKRRGNLPGFTTLYPIGYTLGDRVATTDFNRNHCDKCPAKIVFTYPVPRTEDYETGKCTGFSSWSGGEIKTG